MRFMSKGGNSDSKKSPGFVRTAFQELKHDLKSTQWLRGLGWFVGAVWFAGLLGCMVSFALVQSFGPPDKACQPDGSFRLKPDSYSVWSSSGFFQITLGGGHLTFAQAKVVDIVWDIGVGRGGQLVLALVSWREFARYLTICMETRPVTYQLFRTIFIENDASILSTYRTIRSFVWQRRLRSNVAMFFMASTMIFILAFPTLISAMSGYDSNVASQVQDRDDNLILFNKYSRVFYVVHDGWRINQTGNYWITDERFAGDDPVMSVRTCTTYIRSCSLAKAVSEYVSAYGFHGTRNVISQFYNHTSSRNVTIEAPVLNISAYFNEENMFELGNPARVLNTTWARVPLANNETIDEAYIRDNGKCQNTGDYLWGFSFLQLYIGIILLLFWTTGIYLMWIYTHSTMALRNRLPEEIPGENRAVLELAAAMQDELDIKDIDPSLLREKQLKVRIKKEIQGGSISSAYLSSTLESHSIWKSVKTWFKTEKWWFLAILITSASCGVGWVYTLWVGIIFTFVCFGQLLAFCMGTTAGSRLLVILFWALLGVIMGCVMVGIMYQK